MISFRLLSFTMWCTCLGELRSGAIINFEPPDENDWLEEVVVRERSLETRYTDGRVDIDWRSDRYSAQLEKYCMETFEDPGVTSVQWFEPPKMKCKGEHYYILRLMYDGYSIDCLRIASPDEYGALTSFRPYVIKRYYLKIYYLTTSGECYVKYVEVPERQCSAVGHLELPPSVCEERFWPYEDPPSSSSSDSNPSTLGVIFQPVDA